jgi:hypothetical protein
LLLLGCCERVGKAEGEAFAEPKNCILLCGVIFISALIQVNLLASTLLSVPAETRCLIKI